MASFRNFHRAGLSLAEAIVACFVLTAAMTVSAALYHSALNHSVRIDRMHRAARVVERRLEEIRSWSRQNHGTNGSELFTDGWEAFNGVPSTDPDYPGFSIMTRIVANDLYSPSSAFEEIRFAAQADKNVPQAMKNEKRTLSQSSYLIEVDATWGPGPKDHFMARTLLADPVKDYGWSAEDAHKAVAISVSPNLTSLGPDDFVTLTADVKDAHGRLVKNAVVQWYVDPKSSGNGTIETSPTKASTAIFFNYVKVDKDPDIDGDELTVHTGGKVKIMARVRLGGLEAVNETREIELEMGPE